MSNLLDIASLVLTPSSYKEGKLYSVIPSNGNGDFTATRATTATRVNSAGLVELVPYNLFEYSEDFSNGYWAKTNATITVNTTTAPNFTLTADTITDNATNGQHKVQTAALSDLVTGASFVASAYVKANTATRACLYAYGTSLGVGVDLLTGNQITVSGLTNASPGQVTITNVGNGWYYIELRATVAGAFSIAIMMVNGTDFSYAGSGNSLYYWGAQLTEGTIAKPYQKTETRLNIPRVDYSLGGCPNILLEPQRTNLALQSSSFDSATWFKAGTSVTANSTTSPSGVSDADTLVADGLTSLHVAQQNLGVVNGTSYTFSVYVKKNTNNFIQLYGGIATFGSNVWANFDINSGVVGSVGTSATSRIENVGNGWYRCAFTATAIATTSSPILINIVTSATAARGETNSLSTSVFLWGAQLEVGAYATSYIPTTTTFVTRNTDVLSLSNIYGSIITNSGGTWFMNLKNNISLTQDANIRSMSIGDTLIGTNNTINIIGSPATIRTRVASVVGNTYTTSTPEVSIAIKWDATSISYFVNGVKVLSNGSFPIVNMPYISLDGVNVQRYINEMVIWPTPLSDDELEALTGQGFNTYAAMASYYNYTLQ